jgi:hypothetical protein
LFLSLLLPFQVFAVILSAAKDPEELNSPRPSEPFTTYSVFAFAVSFHQTRETVISTEAARVLYEQRSGEIRFSTSTVGLWMPQAPLLPKQMIQNRIH